MRAALADATEDGLMVELDDGELELLRSTARKVFVDDAGLTEIGELGLLSLLTAEERGGAGWRVVEAVTVASEAGRALSSTNWIGCVVAAGAVAAMPSSRVEALLAGTVSGLMLTHGMTVSTDVGGAHVSGRAMVAGAAPPDVLLVAADGRLLIVDAEAAQAGVRVESEPLETHRGTLIIELTDAAAQVIDGIDSADAAALVDAAVLLHCADSLGALAAMSEVVIGYLSGRDAFGASIASFQVIRHRLADLAVLVVAGEALIREAAVALADRDPQASSLVAAAHSYLLSHCVAALDDCIQLCGGIGFTWEWPVHHAMRRATLNEAVAPVDAVDFASLRSAVAVARRGTSEDAAFREDVRAVIAEHSPFLAREGHRAPESPEQEAAMREWYRTMYDTGLLGANWPPELGGNPEHRPVHELIVAEELIRGRAPRPIDQVMLSSHVLVRFGSPEQQAKYLPRIRSAADIWCQLFSEPDAGSDLAGLKARAHPQPDGTWRLAGQKTWTTDGHWAQFGLGVLRTSLEANRHDGLSVFVVPMDAPGLVVRPMLTIGGAREFNDVFLDGVVLGPEHLIGEVGEGWAIAMSGLEIERFNVGGNVVLLQLLLEDVLTVVENLSRGGSALRTDSAVIAAIDELVGSYHAARAYVTGHVDRVLSGHEGAAEGPIAKIVYTEAYNRIARYGVEVCTRFGPVLAAGEDAAQRLRDAWLWSRAVTISGGTSEIMRNIVAKQRLKLPSGR
jgi:alkylation response protein AidB-like acyl-CoA dehydrogenase